MSGESVAAAAIRILREQGVRRVYGVPGEDHMELLDEIDKQGLRYVLAREEGAAGFMAAADAQASGGIGVLMVTTAPGLAGAINGIANAYLDRVPLLIITGQHDAEKQPVTVRQALDGHALVAPVTKWSVRASSRINQVMARAIDTALAPPSGPVFVELRSEVARMAAGDAPEDWHPVAPATQPVASHDGQSLSGLAGRLRQAERPVVILGAAAPDADTGAAAGRVAVSHGIPVFTTPSAKGAVPGPNPWLAGTFLNGNPEASLVGDADLIVLVGFDAADVFNSGWRYRVPGVAIDPDATLTQHFAGIREQIVGVPAQILDGLSDALGDHRSSWSPTRVADYRQEIAGIFGGSGDRLTIPTAIEAARSVAPDDALVAVDAGFGKPIMSYLWEDRVPGGYFSSQGLSTMGYGLPAGIALGLARPDVKVLSFMGDGSLQMRASELGVAVDEGVGTVFIAWMDGSLAQIEVKQLRRGLGAVGVSLPVRSCEKLAAAFGAAGCDVDTIGGFRTALEDGLARTGEPTLIGARVDASRRDAWFDVLRG